MRVPNLTRVCVAVYGGESLSGRGITLPDGQLFNIASKEHYVRDCQGQWASGKG